MYYIQNHFGVEALESWWCKIYQETASSDLYHIQNQHSEFLEAWGQTIENAGKDISRGFFFVCIKFFVCNPCTGK